MSSDERGADPRRHAADKPDLVGAPATLGFHVVGIGASAGGLQPLQRLFGAIDPTIEACFVVIPHLSPDYKSLMRELLSSHTSMAVRSVEEGAELERGTVFVIPPGKSLVLDERVLHLEDPGANAASRPHFPIDHFLLSLARVAGEDSIAVILSGTGSDGTRGIREINEYGGLVLVQDPASAEFDGMPRSAIQTGVVDDVLAPDELARALCSFVSGRTTRGAELTDVADDDAEVMTAITALVSEGAGVDFRQYKPATIARRIARRRVVAGCSDLRSYLELLKGSPDELSFLRNDLLISVTRFFRDREAWAFLEHEVIPSLVANVPPGETMRFWVTACATGEEAYSLAMLVREAIDRSPQRLEAKIFATDVDESALRRAAAGTYDENVAADLSPERLKAFFEIRDGRYHVTSRLRQMMIFAPHNLIRDAPFTRMQLVTCRNMLIYLQPELQQRVIASLHFALEVGGALFLGASESLGEAETEFRTLERRWKIHEKIRDVRLMPSSTFGEARRRATYDARSGPLNETKALEAMIGEGFGKLLSDRGSACLFLDGEGQLLHVFGDATRYIRLPTGRIDLQATKLVLPELRLPLSTAMARARRETAPVAYSGIRLDASSGSRLVDLRVTFAPAKKHVRTFFCAFLEESARDSLVEPGDSFEPSSQAVERVRELEGELQQTRENLQATIEELETTNEEQQATNEELLASNEELQSTNEELHSVNEELHTVNSEYQAKIEELTQLNADLDNLLRSTTIGVIFLDPQGTIRKFTPAVRDVVKIGERDVGRPLTDLATMIPEPRLGPVLAEVRESRSKREYRVELHDGRVVLVTILPYAGDAIEADGIVLTFVDVSDVEESERKRRALLRKYESLVRTIGEVFYDHCLDDDTIEWSGPVSRLVGTGQASFAPGRAGNAWRERIHPDDLDIFETRFDISNPSARSYELVYRVRRDDGSYRWLRDQGTRHVDESRALLHLIGVLSDVHDTRITGLDRMRRQLGPEHSGSALWHWDLEREDVWVSGAYREMTGLSSSSSRLSVEEWKQQLHPEDRERVWEVVRAQLTGSGHFDERCRLITRGGHDLSVRLRGRVTFDAQRRATQVAGAVVPLRFDRLSSPAPPTESGSPWRGLFERAPLGIALCGADGQLLEVNPTLRRMLGAPQHEVIGTSLPLLPTSDDGTETFADRAARWESEPERTRLATSEGPGIEVEISASPANAVSGERWLYLRDFGR